MRAFRRGIIRNERIGWRRAGGSASLLKSIQSDQKEACTLSLQRLPRHPFHGALKKEGEAAWSSSCSRNARPRKGLVRRAHSRINQATSWKNKRASLEGPLPIRRVAYGISPAVPAQVAQCHMLPCRIWNRDRSLIDRSRFSDLRGHVLALQ